MNFDKKYPIRHENHSLEDKSFNFFRLHLPPDWNVNVVNRDYGQDLHIEIAEDGTYRGLELIIQLKSSKEPNILEDDERQVFKVSTYNYLWDNLRVVMIVKYIESENEAYWILLKDVPEPKQENGTFTVKLPRRQSLSNIDWNEIHDYVRIITLKKIKAVRPGE